MYDQILEARNKYIEDREGAAPDFILFNRVSYGMFLASVKNGEAFQIVHSGEFMGMTIAIIQKYTDKDYFQII